MNMLMMLERKNDRDAHRVSVQPQANSWHGSTVLWVMNFTPLDWMIL